MMRQWLVWVFLAMGFTTWLACRQSNKHALFTLLQANETGIDFSNDIHDNDSTTSFINEFGYMGGGVGIGDFNNDGLKDVFFTGNQVSCRLYINKGNNRFEDITIAAGLTTGEWCTGVSIADVNQDGYDDIYVCVFGKDLKHRSKNLLFINQQNLTFKEQATAYGLADTGYSTQAVFFDFDKDGDLDMYLANYLLSARNGNTIYPKDTTGRSPANDRLYRNDNNPTMGDHPVFTDVSMAAGIKDDGYGLGLSVSDFNNDGWPDIYVANDFLSNDLLWLNNKNGTFTNCIGKALQHQSYSSMGADAADINNDALPDIVTLDMLPETNSRKKTSFSFMNYERYEAERAMHYEPEFMRNMLQLNNGNHPHTDTTVPFFSEIGKLSGISATDWSWSVLLADFNNDGWKDMHITNGIGRDFINADFLEFSSNIFNSNISPQEQQQAIRKKLASLKHVLLPNYLYLNQHDLTFLDVSENSGVNKASMSNGAAYADLDNDGDLDLVVNNINEPAFICINNTVQPNVKPVVHFLKVRLQGSDINRQGIGSKVCVYVNGNVQVQEQYPVRGYFSSVDRDLHFGLDKYHKVDSISIIWPDGKQQRLDQVSADTLLVLSWANAGNRPLLTGQKNYLFTDVTTTSGILYQHVENPTNDFALQRLLPQKFSQLGPFIATADVDVNGTTDFFIGGAFNTSGQLFRQQKDAVFQPYNITSAPKFEEDMACLFFDADNDGAPDLLVTSGDVQYEENSKYYQPRLYHNDGKGNFQLQANAFATQVTTIAGAVTAGDYDGDGDLDLFIGGRVSKNYPLPPRSFILQNNGGVFTDVTSTVCPALQRIGMVTAALWADVDNDKIIDLVVAGEWMPLHLFKGNHRTLSDITGSTGLTQTNGMWRSLVAADVDNDGDLDLVAGNLGLNCDYRVSGKEPMELFATDLDNNGSIDPVPFYYIKTENGKRQSFPAISRNVFADQVPAIKKQFLLYKDYAEADYSNIFNNKAERNIFKLYCNETRSCWFENTGNGKFVKHALPIEAQLSPVNALICADMDGDGLMDLVLAGNEYQAEVNSGRYDASFGCFLKGMPGKKFKVIPPAISGLVIKGDVKDLKLLPLQNGKKYLLAAVNNEKLRAFLVRSK